MEIQTPKYREQLNSLIENMNNEILSLEALRENISIEILIKERDKQLITSLLDIDEMGEELNNLKPKRTYRKYSPETKAKILTEYKTTQDSKVIGAKYDLPSCTLKRWKREEEQQQWELHLELEKQRRIVMPYSSTEFKEISEFKRNEIYKEDLWSIDHSIHQRLLHFNYNDRCENDYGPNRELYVNYKPTTDNLKAASGVTDVEDGLKRAILKAHRYKLFEGNSAVINQFIQRLRNNDVKEKVWDYCHRSFDFEVYKEFYFNYIEQLRSNGYGVGGLFLVADGRNQDMALLSSSGFRKVVDFVPPWRPSHKLKKNGLASLYLKFE